MANEFLKNIITPKSFSADKSGPRKIVDFGYRAVTIEITNRCNFKCTFCPLPSREKPLADMDAANVRSILDQVAADGSVDWVGFHVFGETLMYKDLWECVDYAKSKGLRTLVTTNGLLLTQENIKKLIDHSPNKVVVSVQVLIPEDYMELRGIPRGDYELYFKRVTDCAAALYDQRHQFEEIRFDIAIIDDNYRPLSRIKKSMKVALGMEEWGDPTIHNPTPRSLQPHIESFLKAVASKSKTFKYDPARLQKSIDRYYNEAFPGQFWHVAYDFGDEMVMLFKVFFNGNKMKQYQPIQSATCDASQLGILVDGSMTMCCWDEEGKTTVGNVLQEPIISILERNKRIFEGLRKTGELHFDACKRCMGAPTKLGAKLKDVQIKLRKFRSSNASDQA